MALVMNELGQWDYVIDTADTPTPVVMNPSYLLPANDTMEFKTGSFFDMPSVTDPDPGIDLYQGLGGYYNRAKAQLSRLTDSLKTGLTNVTTTVADTASGIANFWQSTLWKVMIIVLVGGVLFLFAYSFIQAKAGRLANA